MSWVGKPSSGGGGNHWTGNPGVATNADDWSQFPAVQDVDMAGFDVFGVNNITVNDINVTDLVLVDLTVSNDAEINNLTVNTDTVMNGNAIFLGSTTTFQNAFVANGNSTWFGDVTLYGDVRSFAGFKAGVSAPVQSVLTSDGLLFQSGTTDGIRLATIAGTYSIAKFNGVGNPDQLLFIQSEDLMTITTDASVSNNLSVFGITSLNGSTNEMTGTLSVGGTLAVESNVRCNATQETTGAIWALDETSGDKIGMQMVGGVGAPGRIRFYDDGSGTTTDHITFTSAQTFFGTPGTFNDECSFGDDVYITGTDGIKIGEGNIVNAFNLKISTDVSSEKADISFLDGVGSIPLLELNKTFIRCQQEILLEDNIGQTSGTASFKETNLDSLEVENGKIKLPTSTYSDAEFEYNETKLLTADSNYVIPVIKNGTDDLNGAIWATPRLVAINGITGTVYNVDLKTPYSESITIQLIGSGGSLNVNIYETDTLGGGMPRLGFEKVININYIAGSWSCFLNLLDASGNPSATYKYSYMDMSSGSIVGRDVVQRNSPTFSLYTSVHSMRIVSSGDGGGLSNIMYYVEYK